MTIPPVPYFVRAFIHRFDKSCWKCGSQTPVLYAFRPPYNKQEVTFNPKWFGNYEVTPDDDPAMGEALANRFSWYRLGRSMTRDRDVFASYCKHCDSMQGNWYVWKDVLEHWSSNEAPDLYDYLDYTTTYDAENALR